MYLLFHMCSNNGRYCCLVGSKSRDSTAMLTLGYFSLERKKYCDHNVTIFVCIILLIF